MKAITLIEDRYLGEHGDTGSAMMADEIAMYIKEGYIVVQDFQHPAVGRVVELQEQEHVWLQLTKDELKTLVAALHVIQHDPENWGMEGEPCFAADAAKLEEKLKGIFGK